MRTQEQIIGDVLTLGDFSAQNATIRVDVFLVKKDDPVLFDEFKSAIENDISVACKLLEAALPFALRESNYMPSELEGYDNDLVVEDTMIQVTGYYDYFRRKPVNKERKSA